MRTTIDLPDPLLERVKITATVKKTTIRNLVIQGLEVVLKAESDLSPSVSRSALARLQAGYALGNKPLSRDEIHAR
jgi:hypothetical protein